MRSALLWLRSLLAAILALGALAVLARFRPEFPETPDSFSSPVTTAFLHGLAIDAAWLLAALVVLVLLVQSVRGVRASRRHDPERSHLPARMREPVHSPTLPSTHRPMHPLVEEPRLLVPAPRDGEGDGGSSEPTTGAVAPPDRHSEIYLLGPLKIRGRQSRNGLRARALELIAFLALRREGAQRDEILEAFWPGEDPTRSRHRLYQAVRDARRLLGEGVASKRDRYWLDRNRVRVDLDELEQLLHEAGRTEGHRRMSFLVSALSLFRDEPLAGSDFAWSEGEIRRLRGIYVGLLEEVGRACLEAGDPRQALTAAERGIETDLLNEGFWRLALEVEGQLGLREGIEERYERLRTLLDDRLGLEPAPETRRLYLRLLGPAPATGSSSA